MQCISCDSLIINLGEFDDKSNIFFFIDGRWRKYGFRYDLLRFTYFGQTSNMIFISNGSYITVTCSFSMWNIYKSATFDSNVMR